MYKLQERKPASCSAGTRDRRSSLDSRKGRRESRRHAPRSSSPTTTMTKGQVEAIATSQMAYSGPLDSNQRSRRRERGFRQSRHGTIPPFENKYGCIDIVSNVLDSVPAHTDCAFIMPDKKLEKVGKTKVARILKKHRLRMIIKLPENTFFGIGITASIFVFESGVPQNGEEVFGCYIAEDGLMTIKNKGRMDLRGNWPAIEDYWIDVIKKRSGDSTIQWIDPAEHLSYQMPAKPFEIHESDFRRTVLDYLIFQDGLDGAAFRQSVLDHVLYGGDGDE